MATLPPPTTTTSEPGFTAVPAFTSMRNSRPKTLCSSPFMPMSGRFQVPESSSTQSEAFRSSPSVTSRPTSQLQLNSTPMARRASMNLPSTSFGRR